jgi:PAS domain S-box-containing protein
MGTINAGLADRKPGKPPPPDCFQSGFPKKFDDLFAELGEVAVYITDGNANTLAVNKEYENLTGISVRRVIGRNMKDIERAGLIDRSVTLISLKHEATVTIDQTSWTGKKVLITSTPIFNQAGKIVLVTSLLYPWGTKEFKAPSISRSANPTSYTCLENFVFVSQTMREVVERAARAAGSDYTILISGESGVGKGVIAKLVHQLSSRKEKPFIKVNAPSIPKELFESEVFGYKEGAFTGALRSGKRGLAEAAAEGTLFLDEISEIPTDVQAKLLRLLQEKEILPVGSIEPKKVDVRFIAATNCDIKGLVKSGGFREDLFYRLSVIPIHIPPLRERPEDVCALLEHFIRVQCRRFNTRKFLTSAAFQALLDYSWPGNVREMENFIQRLFVLNIHSEITESMIHNELFSEINLSGYQQQPLLTSNLLETMANYEQRLIRGAIQKCGGNLEKTARLLGIHRTTLFRKLHKYQLN